MARRKGSATPCYADNNGHSPVCEWRPVSVKKLLDDVWEKYEKTFQLGFTFTWLFQLQVILHLAKYKMQCKSKKEDSLPLAINHMDVRICMFCGCACWSLCLHTSLASVFHTCIHNTQTYPVIHWEYVTRKCDGLLLNRRGDFMQGFVKYTI